MDWDEEAIKLYLDDELLNEIPLSTTRNGSIGKGTNPFTKPQYLLLNLAIGGINGGPIDEAALPMKYEIDYVRVYQKKRESLPERSGEIRMAMSSMRTVAEYFSMKENIIGLENTVLHPVLSQRRESTVIHQQTCITGNLKVLP